MSNPVQQPLVFELFDAIQAAWWRLLDWCEARWERGHRAP